MGRLTFSLPVILDEPQVDGPGVGHGGWIVTVYDNDHNTVEQVLTILIIATNCTEEEAAIETWEVHHLGKSVVHHGGEEECRKVSEVIATIGIRVEVSKED